MKNVKFGIILVLLIVLLHMDIIVRGATSEGKSGSIVSTDYANDLWIKPVVPASWYIYELTVKYAEWYQIPASLLWGCLKAETNYRHFWNWEYDPFADWMVSSANAVGPYQVLPIAARDVWFDLDGQTDEEIRHRLRYDLDYNVHTAIRYIWKLKHKYELTWPQVFSVYNQGFRGKRFINSYALNITKYYMEGLDVL